MNIEHRFLCIIFSLTMLVAMLPFALVVHAEPETPGETLPAGVTRLQDMEHAQGMKMSAYKPQAVAYGNNVFFLAETDHAGLEPWITDGTEAGTRMVKDTAPSRNGLTTTNSDPAPPVVWNGKVYFAGRAFLPNNVVTPALWVSNGTTDGTVPVSIVSDPIIDIKVGETGLTFLTQTDTGGTYTIWWSDGTAEKTFAIFSWSTVYGIISEYQEYGGFIYYTNKQTRQLSRYHIASRQQGVFSANVNKLIAVANDLLFFEKTTAALGSEIWRTDGSVAGTFQIADLGPGTLNASYIDHEVIGNSLYLLLDVNNGMGGNTSVYATQGASGTITRITPLIESVRSIDQSQGMLFFWSFGSGKYSDYSTWISNGTGTATLKMCSTCFHRPPSSINSFALLPGMFIYSAYEETYGDELWVSDGSDAGSHILLDIYPGIPSSQPHTLISMNDYVFFTALSPYWSSHQPYIYRYQPNPIKTQADTFTAYYYESNVLDVLANDKHTNAAPIKLVDYEPKNLLHRDDRGTPANLADDRLFLGPLGDWANGPYEFFYWVADESGNISSARITIELARKNAPPTDMVAGMLLENSPVGKVAGWINVEDKTIVGKHSCSFTQPNTVFRLEMTGVIPLVPLDYETTPLYTFQVKCADHEGLSLTRNLNFHIHNLNEPPVPELLPEYAAVEEQAVLWWIPWTDPDGTDPGSMYISAQPLNGQAYAGSCIDQICHLDYMPNKDFVGIDSIKIKTYGSEEHTVRIKVTNGDDDPPVMTPVQVVFKQNEIREHQLRLTGIAAGPGEEGPVAIRVSTDIPAMLAGLTVDYNDGPEGYVTFTLHPEEGREASIIVTLDDGVHESEYTIKVFVTDNPPLFLPILVR